jgi:hypothetical protein
MSAKAVARGDIAVEALQVGDLAVDVVWRPPPDPLAGIARWIAAPVPRRARLGPRVAPQWRILTSRGRDVADVAMITSYGSIRGLRRSPQSFRRASCLKNHTKWLARKNFYTPS